MSPTLLQSLGDRSIHLHEIPPGHITVFIYFSRYKEKEKETARQKDETKAKKKNREDIEKSGPKGPKTAGYRPEASLLENEVFGPKRRPFHLVLLVLGAYSFIKL